MDTKVTLKLINELSPDCDFGKIGFGKNLSLDPIEFIEQFGDRVKYKKDFVWLLCRKQFMSDRDMRLFGVWCAKKALDLIEEPTPRILESLNVAERFANNKATIEELDVVRVDANAADYANYAAWDAALAARDAAAWDATDATRCRTDATRSAGVAAMIVCWNAQIEQLKTYFNPGGKRDDETRQSN